MLTVRKQDGWQMFIQGKGEKLMSENKTAENTKNQQSDNILEVSHLKKYFPIKWINSIIIDLVFIYFYSFPYPRWSDSKSIESHRCSFSKRKDITFFYIYKVLYQKKCSTRFNTYITV